MYGKNCNLRTLSREYDCLAKIGTKEAFTLLLGNYVKRQHAPTRTDNQRQIYIYIYDLVPKGAQMGGQIFDCQ